MSVFLKKNLYHYSNTRRKQLALAHNTFVAQVFFVLKFLSLIVFLSSCAQQPFNQAAIQPSTPPQYWQVDGKLALKTMSSVSNGEKPKRQTLRFKWQQKGSSYQITLSGGLGIGSTTINKTANKTIMLRGKSIIAEAPNPEALFEQITGMYLPVSLLQHWVLGQPSPNANANANIDINNGSAQSELNSFTQQGWQVSYPSAIQVNNHLLPRKMTASNPNLNLTAVFKHWKIFQPNGSTVQISQH